MKRYEARKTLFSRADLSFIREILNEPFHPTGSVGMPQRYPLGIFKAHIVKRMKHVPNDRLLFRQMWKDAKLKGLRHRSR